MFFDNPTEQDLTNMGFKSEENKKKTDEAIDIAVESLEIKAKLEELLGIEN